MASRRTLFRSACVSGAFLILALPGVAQAHGRLKGSSPAAGAHLGMVPREIRLEFSEVPDLAFSVVTLTGPSGASVPLGTLSYTVGSRRSVFARIRTVLATGTYRVRWQLAGDDGHPVRGEFDFVVAPGAMVNSAALVPMDATSDSANDAMAMHHDPASMPQGEGFGVESPGYVILRWAQFVAMLLAIGTVAFRQFVLAVLRRQSGTLSFVQGAESRAARVARPALVALALTLIGRLFAQSYAMHGAAQLWDMRLSAQMIEHTVWGRGWLVQLAGIVLSTVGFVLVPRAHGGSGSPAAGWSLATLGVVLLALSSALSGHAAAVPRFRSLAVLADTLHVIGASSWLGSLTLVLAAGLPVAAELGNGSHGAGVARLVKAFSPVALASAALTLCTGGIAAWLHVGSIPNLWATRYGITLLVKLAVLGVVALTGFYNWRLVQPALGTDVAARRLRRSAALEVGVAVIVLLVTAVLVATPTSMDMQM